MKKSRKPKVKNDHLLLDKNKNEQIRVGSQRWYNWLEENRGFVFEGNSGHLTARREMRRGMLYWYGYRRRGGKLSKMYLGKSEDLTHERLEQVSASLAGQATLAQLSRKSNLADLIAALETLQSETLEYPGTPPDDRV